MRRSPSPRPYPSGRGRQAPRWARKPAAGWVRAAFELHAGRKTPSSPRETARMRGKAASNSQAAICSFENPRPRLYPLLTSRNLFCSTERQFLRHSLHSGAEHVRAGLSTSPKFFKQRGTDFAGAAGYEDRHIFILFVDRLRNRWPEARRFN